MEIRKSKQDIERLAKYKKSLIVKDKISSQLALKTPEAITPEAVVEEDTEVQKRELVLNNTKQLLKNRQEAFSLSSMIISNDLETFFNTNFSGIKYYVEKRLTNPSAEVIFNYIKSLEAKEDSKQPNLGEAITNLNSELQLLQEIIKKLEKITQKSKSILAKDLLDRADALNVTLQIDPKIVSNFGGEEKVVGDLRNINEALGFASETSEEDKAENVYQSVSTLSVLADVSQQTLSSQESSSSQNSSSSEEFSEEPSYLESSSISSSLRSIPYLDLFLQKRNLTKGQLTQLAKDILKSKNINNVTPKGNKAALIKFINDLLESASPIL